MTNLRKVYNQLRVPKYLRVRSLHLDQVRQATICLSGCDRRDTRVAHGK
jgi:hypothetical protein